MDAQGSSEFYTTATHLQLCVPGQWHTRLEQEHTGEDQTGNLSITSRALGGIRGEPFG